MTILITWKVEQPIVAKIHLNLAGRAHIECTIKHLSSLQVEVQIPDETEQ